MSLAVAALIADVRPGTIIQWVRRGLIRRYPDGYDQAELLARIDSRDCGKAIGGMKAAHNRVTSNGSRETSVLCF